MKKKKRKTWILKLDRDDPEKEIDFEIRYQMTLTTEEHFKRMISRSSQIAKMMAAHGHKKTPGMFQRT